MSAYVAVQAMDVSTIETLGGIHNMSCRCYIVARGDTAAEAYEGAEDDSAIVYDWATGEQVDPT